MATEAEIHDCVWRVAGEYLSQSYEELLALEQSMPSGVADPPRWVDCGGEEALADIHVGGLGLFRPRICVEVILTGGGDGESQYTSIVYFERFRSGKLTGPWGPAPIPEDYVKRRRGPKARDRP